MAYFNAIAPTISDLNKYKINMIAIARKLKVIYHKYSVYTLYIGTCMHEFVKTACTLESCSYNT